MIGRQHQYDYTPLPQPVRITEHDWPEGTVPLVSITCCTYNHVKFIRDSIEGFLMQETTFPVEIIIHDDASTDGTDNIVQSYVAKYPQLIRPIYQTENQFSRGNRPWQFLEPVQRGKYIAVSDGDDYWTSKKKLQIQVLFLDSNKNFSFCFHDVKILDYTNDSKVYDPYVKTQKMIFDSRDIILNHVISTLSICYRRGYDYPRPIPEPFISFDRYLAITLSFSGLGYRFPAIMGCYRHHDGGITKKSYKDPYDRLEQVTTNYRNLYSCILDVAPKINRKHLRLALTIYADYPKFRFYLKNNFFLFAIRYLFIMTIESPKWVYAVIRKKFNRGFY